MSSSPLLLSVIVPLALPWEPVYRWEGPGPAPTVGTRIRVGLMGRSYVGLVSGVGVETSLPPEKIQRAGAPVTGLSPITETEIRFWRTLADYYLCTVGEVYKSAYPLQKSESEETAARVLEQKRRRLEKLRLQCEKARFDTTRARYQAEIQALEAELSGGPSRPEAQGTPLPPPTAAQADVLAQIDAAPEGRTLLLSGADPDRRAVFQQLIAKTLAAGKSVLLLVPEIAQGEQREREFSAHFPGLLCYHSAETPARRRDIAAALQAEGPYLLLGTRSALLLPHRELGLILVDDEHDPSYKQDAPAPRYNARSAAIFLAGLHPGARVILGSATPSLESLYNARAGRFLSLSLPTAAPAERAIEIIDIPAERRKRGMPGLLSRRLIDSIRNCPGKALLLIPQHSAYCPREQVEEEAIALFGRTRIESGALLIGPQAELLRSGVDLADFSLVALVQADALLLSQTDFRADERAAQLLESLYGRCRSGVTFVIQTARAQHPLWAHFAAGDFNGYAEGLLAERAEAGLPPCTRMLRITLSDPVSEKRLAFLSDELAGQLGALLGPACVTGPFPPPASEGLRQIRICLPRDRALTQKKRRIATLLQDFAVARHYGGQHISLDVDPL